MTTILAQAALGGYSFFEIAKWIIIIAALCAIVFVALKAMQITIPEWLRNILIILAVAIVALFALRILLSA